MGKYENGYWDKIDYWADTLKEAVDRKDIEMVKKAAEKLNYFHKRQEEVYG